MKRIFSLGLYAFLGWFLVASTPILLGAGVEAAARPEFSFYCESGNCPQGPYQKSCPWCSSQAPQGKSRGYLQCFCFDDNSQLSNPSILHRSADCQAPRIIDNDNGNLICKRNLEEDSAIEVKAEESEADPIQMEAVEFDFNCVSKTGDYHAMPANNCPVTKGNYKNFCPRCNYDTSNGFDTLECLCFDEQNSMKKGISYLQTSDQRKCKKKVYNAVGGKLVCG